MPNDLLDLNLEQVNAVVAGGSEREITEECHCIITGYYAGYYMGAKKPKKPSEFINKLLRHADKISGKSSSSTKEDPDIEFFKSMESRFARNRLEELKNCGKQQ